MAGGVANKTVALLNTARAKLTEALHDIEQMVQIGNPEVSSRSAAADTSIGEAITALEALE
jgi:hypothetical protein